MRSFVALILCFFCACPAAARVDPQRLGAAHFVGLWSMDGAEGCAGGDTLTFFATGIWAVTQGGGNPVEALGTWTIGDNVLELTESKIGDPLTFEEMQASIDGVLESSMEITVVYKDGRKLSYTLDRCP
jgi:hypothetical protein